MFVQPFTPTRHPRPSSIAALLMSILPAIATAQTATSTPTPTPAPSPSTAPKPTATPDDAPSVRAGVTIFSDFTYTTAPSVKDADGNAIKSSAFDVGRAYLNVTGSMSRLVSFRVTADVKRLTTAGATTSIDGSESFRLKYAFGQISLDSFLPKGSFVRIGAQQTPLIDYMESISKYRFQGTAMVEREGFLSSSDFGIAGRVNLPKDYGEVYLGVYNGESYGKAEVNDQKSFQIRATLRPLPKHDTLKGLRVTGFYDVDRYVKGAPRNRFVVSAAFEHKYVVANADFIEARDQASARAALIESSAYSVWVRPRTTMGVEGLLRYDHYNPTKGAAARRNRTILGVSYWFKTQAPMSAALLLDYEKVSYVATPTKPREGRLALHTLFAF